MSEGKELINTVNMIVNDDLLGPDHAKYNILIDNEGYYANDDQTVTKISDYEYKVFQLYFLTDEILKGKTDFSITIKLNALENIADTYELRKTQENKALENTKVINPDSGKATYKYMTKEIEEVKVTSLQIKIVPTVKEFVFKDDGTDQKLVELDAINVNLN